ANYCAGESGFFLGSIENFFDGCASLCGVSVASLCGVASQLSTFDFGVLRGHVMEPLPTHRRKWSMPKEAKRPIPTLASNNLRRFHLLKSVGNRPSPVPRPFSRAQF